MSSGDIDDTLGPEGELEALASQHSALRAYLTLMSTLPILKGQTPFSAGISTDGRTRYIDPRLATILDGVDLSPALATHESIEWALREFCQIGVDYGRDPRGHRLANRAEAEMAESLGFDWETYSEFIDPQVRAIEALPLTAVPGDLALYPYEGNAHFLAKVTKARGLLTKPSVRYQDVATDMAHCAGCINYDADLGMSRCAIVAGTIAAGGWCKEWADEKVKP